MKIIFAGTPHFAALVLEALLHSPHEVMAVWAQPDRPSGRGLKKRIGPVKNLATFYKLPLYQPSSLKEAETQKELTQFGAAAMVVAAYGLILPPAILHLFPYGCINVHPSLLPRFRGAAPIQRALFSGHSLTGVTIMQMEAGLDTGPILLQKEYVVKPDETSQTLQDTLAVLGGEILIKTLTLLEQKKITAKPQDEALATYASKITKGEALLDWTLSAKALEQQVRAFNPWPIAYCVWNGEHLRIWEAKALDKNHTASPQTLLNASQNGIDIATSRGILRLLRVQLPGGKVLSIKDFYNAQQAKLLINQPFL